MTSSSTSKEQMLGSSYRVDRGPSTRRNYPWSQGLEKKRVKKIELAKGWVEEVERSR